MRLTDFTHWTVVPHVLLRLIVLRSVNLIFVGLGVQSNFPNGEGHSRRLYLRELVWLHRVLGFDDHRALQVAIADLVGESVAIHFDDARQSLIRRYVGKEATSLRRSLHLYRFVVIVSCL